MKSALPSPCLLTTGELALFLDVTRKSVSKWCDEGRLKCHPFPGRNCDRRIEISEALAFARREKQYLDALEAKAIRAGVMPIRCPRVLIVSPTVEYVLPLVQSLLAPTPVDDAATGGLLLADRSYAGVILDAALPRSEAHALIRLAHRQRPDCTVVILASEDDPNPKAWVQHGADMAWQKPVDFPVLANWLCQQIACPRPPTPPVPPLKAAA